MTRAMAGLLFVTLALLVPADASALITGGVGNEPVNDPGWPKGADVIFNHVGRVAWWEGPPFGGGQRHAECRGDTNALNAVVANFAKLDVKHKRVVVHDGSGHSFWLNKNKEPDKLEAAKIDWVFMIWQPDSWERLRKLPAELNPTAPSDTGPPSQIDVFTANIRWEDVVVPAGIEVIDERLEAHGFTAVDGVVIEGRVTNLSTSRPIVATIRLQQVEPQKTGGYLYPVIAESKANEEGRWALLNVPAGWVRVVVEADGFVPRVAGYAQFDEQPQWKSYDTELIRSTSVSGRITDEAGKPLADVEVKLRNIQSEAGGRYESPREYTFMTDAEGRFRADQVPRGKATITLFKPGYCRPGLGPTIMTHKKDVELQMIRSGGVLVTVDFTGKEQPENYIVHIEPKEGMAIGTFGGSGKINEENQIVFQNVPPGTYVLKGQPNPSSAKQISETVTVDLKGGEAAQVTLKAK